jgi:hypothetical protein
MFQGVLKPDIVLSAYWDMCAHANHAHALGGVRNEYAGIIMHSSRNWVRNTGNLYETESQNYGVNLNYRNPIRSLFGNVSLNYFNNKANLLYGNDFDGIPQVQTSLAQPNRLEPIRTISQNVQWNFFSLNKS